jgi:hypothetical protein
MTTSLERTAAGAVLACTILIGLATLLAGIWDGQAQDAQARSLDAVAITEQQQLAGIYAALPSSGLASASSSPSPASTPSPKPSTSSSEGNLFSAFKTSGQRRFPTAADVNGWASLRQQYASLANLGRVATILLTVAIAIVAAGAAFGQRWAGRLLLAGVGLAAVALLITLASVMAWLVM